MEDKGERSAAARKRSTPSGDVSTSPHLAKLGTAQMFHGTWISTEVQVPQLNLLDSKDLEEGEHPQLVCFPPSAKPSAVTRMPCSVHHHCTAPQSAASQCKMQIWHMRNFLMMMSSNWVQASKTRGAARSSQSGPDSGTRAAGGAGLSHWPAQRGTRYSGSSSTCGASAGRWRQQPPTWAQRHSGRCSETWRQ